MKKLCCRLEVFIFRFDLYLDQRLSTLCFRLLELKNFLVKAPLKGKVKHIPTPQVFDGLEIYGLCWRLCDAKRFVDGHTRAQFSLIAIEQIVKGNSMHSNASDHSYEVKVSFEICMAEIDYLVVSSEFQAVLAVRAKQILEVSPVQRLKNVDLDLAIVFQNQRILSQFIDPTPRCNLSRTHIQIKQPIGDQGFESQIPKHQEHWGR